LFLLLKHDSDVLLMYAVFNLLSLMLLWSRQTGRCLERNESRFEAYNYWTL